MPLKDGNNIIYVNAENKGREDLNNLMQSLISYNYSDMKDKVIKECVVYYKTTEDGEDKVCEAVHNYAVKYAQNYAKNSYNEGKDDGINIGIAKGTVKTLINLVNSGNITLECAIENSGLSKEKFISIADSLGYKL